jgi:hypothetical protein
MEWTNEFLDQKRTEADPLADDVLKKLIQSNGLEASRKLFDKLIRNIDLPVDDLPDEIQDFMEATLELPDWLSEEDLDRSNAFFVDHGPKLLLLLYFKSLPLLYSDAKGAEVLVKTSRLTHSNTSMEIFTRRIAETGQFLLNVMANDNFKVNKMAINSIRKVRLIHAAIRQFIAPGWDEQALGKPINQEDMALTLMSFSVSMIDGLEQLLVDEKDHLIHAYFERWRAIGVLLGVSEDLIPQNIDDGRLLLNIIVSRQSAASESGQLLTKALVEFSKKTIPGKIFDVTPEALIIYFSGREMAEHLGLKITKGCFGFGIPALLASVFHLIEKLEDRSDRIEYVTNRLSKKLVVAMVDYFDDYKERKFEVPEEFRTAWNL